MRFGFALLPLLGRQLLLRKPTASFVLARRNFTRIMDFKDIMSETAQKETNKILQSAEVQTIGSIFARNGFEIRLVGGIVRDLVLGIPPNDIDLATTAKPPEMVSLLQAENIRVVETGLQHGTITAVINQINIEITTLRIDTDQDGRHARVEFTSDWGLDAARRDLTVNALSMDLNGKIYDYFNGYNHLMQQRILFVGDADQRIREDYLRILRYFRFHGRLSTQPLDEQTLQAVSRNVEGLQRISGERIWSETAKIIAHESCVRMINGMIECHVTHNIGIPFIQQNHLLNLEFVHRYTRNPITLMCSLLPNIAEFELLVARWHFSKIERDLGIFILSHRDKELTYEISQDFLVEDNSLEHVLQLLSFKGLDQIKHEIEQWLIPVFPVTGKLLISKGVPPGRHMGDILRTVKSAWIASRFTLNEQALVEQALQLAPSKLRK